jgi:hypothetical protein
MRGSSQAAGGWEGDVSDRVKPLSQKGRWAGDAPALRYWVGRLMVTFVPSPGLLSISSEPRFNRIRRAA